MTLTPAGRRRPRAAPLHASAADAGAAGLRYVTDDRPGIRRLRRGSGFRYVRPDGSAVRDAATLERIAKLAIPPAYRDVWIAADARAHLQATGRDARGRKQYRYHALWRAVRDETKFDRMLAFSRRLPAIRRRVERDLRLPGLPREKVLAAIVRLLEDTCIRVGNAEYARTNDSYGLTTLRDKHAEVKGSRIRFEFRGKLGKEHVCELHDKRLARVVAGCQALPGAHLLQCVGEDGQRHAIGSEDVNAYLRAASGEDFTAKDFRTWAGSLQAADALLREAAGDSQRLRKRQVLAALDEVAERLHNTRTVCRAYYVHPRLLETFEEGQLAASYARARRRAGGARGLRAEERALVGFLEAAARRGKAPAVKKAARVGKGSKPRRRGVPRARRAHARTAARRSARA